MPLKSEYPMFVNGPMKFGGKFFNATATTSGGNVVFWITNDGTSGGSAVFSDVVMESIMCTAVSTTMPVSYGTPVLSGDKKSITIPCYQPGTSNSLVTILGISVLSGVTLVPVAAANGISVRMIVQGIL